MWSIEKYRHRNGTIADVTHCLRCFVSGIVTRPTHAYMHAESTWSLLIDFVSLVCYGQQFMCMYCNQTKGGGGQRRYPASRSSSMIEQPSIIAGCTIIDGCSILIRLNSTSSLAVHSLRYRKKLGKKWVQTFSLCSLRFQCEYQL